MLSLVRTAKTLLLTLVLSSCAAVPITVPIEAPIEATVGFRGGDQEIGSVGGGGDSIALWLAIIGLVVTPVLGAGLYKYAFRPLRIWKEKNGNGHSTGKNGGQGDKLCVEYSRWGPPSSHLPDVPHLGHLTDGIQKTNGK